METRSKMSSRLCRLTSSQLMKVRMRPTRSLIACCCGHIVRSVAHVAHVTGAQLSSPKFATAIRGSLNVGERGAQVLKIERLGQVFVETRFQSSLPIAFTR